MAGPWPENPATTVGHNSRTELSMPTVYEVGKQVSCCPCHCMARSGFGRSSKGGCCLSVHCTFELGMWPEGPHMKRPLNCQLPLLSSPLSRFPFLGRHIQVTHSGHLVCSMPAIGIHSFPWAHSLMGFVKCPHLLS